MKELIVHCNGKTIRFYADEKTTIREFWSYVYNKVYINEDNFELSDKQCYRLCSFVVQGERKLAISDYSVIKFLDNFNINYNEIIALCSDNYGIGGDFTINNTIKIQINANEPKHNNPHVHVTRPNKHDKYYRLDINTLTQMKGDKEDWKKEFNLKERRIIKEVIIENKKTLMNYYNNARKGEYTTDAYYIEYEGKKMVIN